MQRKPFKQKHLFLTAVIIIILIIVFITATILLGHPKEKSITSSSSSETSKTYDVKKHSTSSSSSSSVDKTSESISVKAETGSTDVLPTTASSAAASAISSVKNDATEKPISDNQSTNSSSVSFSSSSISSQSSSQPVSNNFGNWSLANFNTVSLGHSTYDQVKAVYGNPTNLIAGDTVIANWISTSGAKVAITFTPTGTDNNIKLIASYKTQSGLQ
ncbi:hypothetical protein [Leuconostoc palmae]|uniref:hypothetical protein n=1 Tax=Leuconostoc palmae TaxID=501487 RepID=UPI001C7D7238|nr:hypothetical protein [Leuconostoc palmae]